MRMPRRPSFPVASPRNSRQRLAAAAALCALTITGCGSGATGAADGAGGSSAGPSGAGGATATNATTSGGGLPTGSCSPACVAPQFCSVTAKCIDPGTCAAHGDCGEGTQCDAAQSKCVPGGGCGAQELEADLVAPNMLIVLDRSCSMKASVGGKPKWTIAVEAIEKLTTSYSDGFRFGLTLFPDLAKPDCDQGPIPIPVGDAKHDDINKLLKAALNTNDPNYPNGPCVTNIDTGMAQAENKEPAFKDKQRKSYVLLVTDGAQSGSCGGNQGDARTLDTIKALTAAGISTYVVGFGAASDLQALDSFAEAGGTALAGAHKYYLAENQPELEAAFADIATKSLSCTLELKGKPEDASKIYVFFDEAPVSRDPSKKEGWEYDATKNQVIFYGDACTQLKSGEVQDVDIVFGCATPTPT